jgi:hypothetical protein
VAIAELEPSLRQRVRRVTVRPVLLALRCRVFCCPGVQRRDANRRGPMIRPALTGAFGYTSRHGTAAHPTPLRDRAYVLIDAYAYWRD